MSYEKIRSIKIDKKNNKVFFISTSNNIKPLNYHKEEYPYYSNILKEKGFQELQIELLKGYESGNLQEGNNKYKNAFLVLLYVFNEEYQKFNWRFHEEDLRETKKKEFNELLLKCLKYKIPKDRFIIYKEVFDKKVYAKCCLTCIKWLYNKEKATKFLFEEQAKNNIYNNLKDICKIEKI